MGVKDVVGGVSAATLGYITGGIKGAKYGLDSYRHFSKRMPPIAKNRTSGRAGTKRRASLSTGYKTIKKRKVSKSVVRASKKGGSGGNTFASAGYSTGHVRKRGRKRPVKVSRMLRKKIMKVLDNDRVVGRYTHVSYYQITPGKPFSGAFDDQQTVEYFGMYTSQLPAGAGGSNRILFSPMWVLYSVGRLLQSNQVTKANGYPIVYSDIANITNTKYLNFYTARVKVLKQSAIYRMRNNTGRVVTCKVYCLSPKTVDSSFGNVGYNCKDVWNNNLDIQDNIDADGNIKGENPTSVKLETLYANPKQSQGFRAHYKVEETIVTLEPGKEYVYKVDGPAMEYDFAKFWLNNGFYDKQKFTKTVLFVCYNDLVRTSLGVTGRYTDQSVNDPQSILIEQTCFIKYAIPDQAGFMIPGTLTTGTQQTLNQVRTVFGIDVHQSDQTGNADYVADENPISLSTVP